MGGQSRAGTDWSGEELDLIVADYFAMLCQEQADLPYGKTAHRRALMQNIDRSDASIEFKHQNISAVLTELGLPRISGYMPREHYQNALLEAIGGYLATNPEPIPFLLRPAAGFADMQDTFEEAPSAPRDRDSDTVVGLERLIRKFDPALRDQLNRLLGQAGEQHILELEQRRLIQFERPDLARKVRWVSKEDGDGAGYDIRSWDRTGSERLIEVKTTRGANTTPFYLTRNENDVAQERPDAFRLYRLYDFSRLPRLFTLTPPLESVLKLEPMTFRASLK